ncbi:hypothetical protein ACQ4PT_026424 [Festuca glaucescens]
MASGAAAVTDPDRSSGGVPIPSRSEKGKDVQTAASGSGNAGPSEGDRVEQMMANLRLTAAESKAVVIDDVDDLELVDPDRTFVGKVLAPDVLHIQTIRAAMRPAWGNPKGLVLNLAGNNLFVAEFGSKADRDRIMDGSPWVFGKHDVLMKKYDVDVLPQDVVFDRFAIWARIPALPNRLMKAERGKVIAEPIGLVRKVEAHTLGRCWGGYMRLRVEVKVTEPLMRAVTVFSSRLQTTESYAVQYEHLPIYYFSCDMLGHSTLACANPAERDVNGDLPYSAKRLSVEDSAKKSGGSKSGTNAVSTEQSRMSANGAHQGRGKVSGADPGHVGGAEVSSPLKGCQGASRGRGRSGLGRGRGRKDGNVKKLFPDKTMKPTSTGHKRKPSKRADTLMIEEPPTAVGTLALVAMTNKEGVMADDDVHGNDSNKKQRTTPMRSADPAEAAMQPRLTQ